MTSKSRPLEVLVLSKYGMMGASSRLRFYQYWPWLERKGIRLRAAPLLDDSLLQQRYRTGSYGSTSLLAAYARRWQTLRSSRSDVIWIEAEAFPMLPLWMERLALGRVPFVLDFDDAIFHNYDLHRLALVRALFGRRIDRLMQDSTAVTAGNAYLAARAKAAGANRVVRLPTVIDLDRYPAGPVDRPPGRRIVWIGSPSTARYLTALQAPLRELAARSPFTLRVIGAGPGFTLPGVPLESIAWSEDTEVASIRECDVGVMPLAETAWELGKCGYKLIQYMACSLPVVASPVGANLDIVRPEVNGLFAATPEEWIETLQRLLASPSLRTAMGAAGRQDVEERYCVQRTCDTVAATLRQAAHEEA